MKKRFLLLLLLPLFFFSCDKCSKKDCDCLYTSDNGFAFIPETNLQNQGFSKSELDTITLEKYTRDSQLLVASEVFVLDTLKSLITDNPLTTNLIYNRKNDWRYFDAIYINEDNPINNGPDFDNYDYLIRVGNVKHYRITSMEIKGHQEDIDCCNCYKNDRKTITINSVPFDFTGIYSSESTFTLRK